MAITEHDDIKKLNNKELLEQTHQLVREERRIGTLILNRLKEISRRRLYNSLGYSSTFTYLVQELKYSEACAFRLNNAMKLLAEVPEVEAKIKAGALSVTTVSQVQAFCQAQKRENGLSFKTEDKKKLLKQVEGSSKREAEKILASLYPQAPLPTRDSQRPIAGNCTEIKFVASDALIEKLTRIKELTSHKTFNPSYSELLDYMAETVLNKIDPVRKIEKREEAEKKSESRSAAQPAQPAQGKTEQAPLTYTTHGGSAAVPTDSSTETLVASRPNDVPAKNTAPLSPVLSPVKVGAGGRHPRVKMSRYIPVKIKEQVWVRDGGQCCFVSPETGRRCTERSGLEYEHIIPFAKGGTNDIWNIELLCVSHNLSAALEQYGQQKMSLYL